MATGAVGIGAPAAFGLLVLTESGVPVPIPADVLLLLVGERVAAGAVPLGGRSRRWSVRRSAREQPAARRTRAAGAVRRGDRVHLGHLVLGYLLGPLAWEAIERARGPALAALAAVVVVGAVVWFRRRSRRAAAQAFTEGICPACLAADWLAERSAAGPVTNPRG